MDYHRKKTYSYCGSARSHGHTCWLDRVQRATAGDSSGVEALLSLTVAITWLSDLSATQRL